MIRLRLILFDITRGLPTAARVLAARLGWRKTLRVFALFLRRSATTRPFRALGSDRPSAAERFTRHQLKPVLLLDDVLRKDLLMSQEEALALLAEVVGASGAQFIASQLSPPSPAAWRSYDDQAKESFARRVMARFLNAEAELVPDDRSEVAFDVTFCHFAHLTRRLERPELAPLFCRADSAYFSRPEAPVELRRAKTIAQGDDRCEFRFYLD